MLGKDSIHIFDMFANVSAYILAALFTGSIIFFMGLRVGMFSKKSSKAFSYVFTQRS